MPRTVQLQQGVVPSERRKVRCFPASGRGEGEFGTPNASTHIFHTTFARHIALLNLYEKYELRSLSLPVVTPETMKPSHVKAARALLEWSAEELADVLPIGVATLRSFESGKAVQASSRQAIFDALHAYGVRMRGGKQPGVSIVPPEKWAINLKPMTCPKCSGPLPMIRKPKTLREVLWGGWTCASCGTKVDKGGCILG